MKVRISYMSRVSLFALAVLLSFSSCRDVCSSPIEECPDSGDHTSEKIGGVAFVSPNRVIGAEEIGYILESKAGWVQLIPYGFSRAGQPTVNFDWNNQWWGETVDGTRSMIRDAKSKGLNVLVKPHIWVLGQGWAGDYTLESEEDWKIWEEGYTDYIMTFARLSEEENVEMVCIGTEFKKVVQNRPDFFGRLADSVRTVYSGKVTYAANWDNYEEVVFWDKLDYIGIDAYFPLVDAKTPEVEDLMKAWEDQKSKLETLSRTKGISILFTEWGYLSVDNAGWKNWELESNLSSHPINMDAQVNCYQAMFKSFWDETWFAGGFAWNWYSNHTNAGGENDRDYTSQNKPAMNVLREWYGKQQ